MSRNIEEQRAQFLNAFLSAAAFDGWSPHAFAVAAKKCKLDDFTARRLFPAGIPELVEEFTTLISTQMNKRTATANITQMKIRERVKFCVKARLEESSRHRAAIGRLLPYLALPINSGLSLRLLYKTVDEIWRICGDTATDFNFYSKRMLLAGVYSSTLVYWLGDESDDFADSWAFLDRRIEDVMQIQKIKAKLFSKT